VKLRANGDILIVYNARSNRISTWRISDLKRLHGFSDYDASAPLEDGAHVLTANWSAIRLQTFDGKPVGPIAIEAPRASSTLDMGPKLSSPPKNLPVSLAGKNAPSEIWIGPGGSFASFDARRGVPFGGVIAAGTTTASTTWEVHERARTILRTSFEGLTEEVAGFPSGKEVAGFPSGKELAKVNDDAPGEVVARGDSVCRLSADRERVLGVNGGIESVRK